MKIVPENLKDVTEIIAAEFKSFGGGKEDKYNPLSAALKDGPPLFALGVNIEDVVCRVAELLEEIEKTT